MAAATSTKVRYKPGNDGLSDSRSSSRRSASLIDSTNPGLYDPDLLSRRIPIVGQFGSGSLSHPVRRLRLMRKPSVGPVGTCEKLPSGCRRKTQKSAVGPK